MPKRTTPPTVAMTPEEFTAACERLGITMSEIADRLGISRITVQSYKSGKLHVSPITAMAMKALASDLGKPHRTRRAPEPRGSGAPEAPAMQRIGPDDPSDE